MSSFSGRYLCRVCKDPEVLPLRPLVQCDSCKGGWHPACNPIIGDQKYVFIFYIDCSDRVLIVITDRKAPFCCSRCLRKKNKAPQDSNLPTISSGEMGMANGSPDLSGLAPQNRKPIVMVKMPPQPKHLQRKNTLPSSTDSDSRVLKRKRPEKSKRTYSDLWSLREIKPRPLSEAQAATWPENSLGSAHDQPPSWPPPHGAKTRAWYPPTVEDEHIIQLRPLTPQELRHDESK